MLYVDLVMFQIESALATEMFKGDAEAHVWVIDVQSGQTRWPTDTQGYAARTDRCRIPPALYPGTG